MMDYPKGVFWKELADGHLRALCDEDWTSRSVSQWNRVGLPIPAVIKPEEKKPTVYSVMLFSGDAFVPRVEATTLDEAKTLALVLVRVANSEVNK